MFLVGLFFIDDNDTFTLLQTSGFLFRNESNCLVLNIFIKKKSLYNAKQIVTTDEQGVDRKQMKTN